MTPASQNAWTGGILALDWRAARAYLYDGLWLSVLDARIGELLRTIAVGVGPRAIAVDERTGQVVVANNGGMVQATTTTRWRRIPTWLRRCLHLSSGIVPAHIDPGSIMLIDMS